MSIVLGHRSLSRLVGVHPDLVRVFKRAALLATPEQDFTILEGVRSIEQMCVNYGKGRTAAQCRAKGIAGTYAQPNERKVTWLNKPLESNHGVKADGFGHAVDAAPYPIDWNNIARFKALAELIKSAAIFEGVSIICGADWKSPDFPHVELAGE